MIVGRNGRYAVETAHDHENDKQRRSHGAVGPGTKRTCFTPAPLAPAVADTNDVDVPAMSLELHEWDIHAV
jgi:hypothetical protein